MQNLRNVYINFRKQKMADVQIDWIVFFLTQSLFIDQLIEQNYMYFSLALKKLCTILTLFLLHILRIIFLEKVKINFMKHRLHFKIIIHDIKKLNADTFYFTFYLW